MNICLVRMVVCMIGVCMVVGSMVVGCMVECMVLWSKIFLDG